MALLADDYSEDWDTLWWVRVDGRARIVENCDGIEQQLDMLAEWYMQYMQYRQARPAGPVIVIAVERWSG